MSKLIVFPWFIMYRRYRFFGGPYRYPWFCKKRQGRGKEKEREKDKEKGKGRKIIGKYWEEEKKRKRRVGEEKEMKWRGKEKEWKRKRKGRQEERKRKREKRKGVKAEEGKKRKGKRKGSICGLVWGYFLNKWISLRFARGTANSASYMYVTLCKTTSDVDIMHNYSYRLWGGPIATQCCAFSKHPIVLQGAPVSPRIHGGYQL